MKTSQEAEAAASDTSGPAPGTEGIPAVPIAAPEQRDLRKTGLHPNFWYPLARSRELRAGKALGVTFAGEPIVLVRPKEGAIYALEDRCAHRQVPLHLGEVDGAYLQCSYHCWSYDREGKCIGAPYVTNRADLPDGVRSYPCREEYGLVFVFPGDRELAEVTPFPEIPSANNPKYKTRYLDRSIDCHYSFMHENLMDMNHQFLHRRWMGGIQTVFLDLREDERGVEVDYTFRRVKGKQPIGERFIIGRKDTTREERKSDLMTIRTEYPYQTLRFWTAGADEPALDLWNVYVPRDKQQRINHTYGLMMIRRPPIPGAIHVLWPAIKWFTNRIFAEDRWIVELEQKAFDDQGADWNQEVFPAIQRLRSLLTARGVPLEPAPPSP